MKSLNLFKSVALTSLMILAGNVFAQKGIDDGSKFGRGEDSLRCIRNLSLYREYARQKNFEMAEPYWKIVFDECPMSSKNIYIDGAKIIREMLDKTISETRKAELTDTLMLLYDRRIKYFGEKGEVRGRQGVDLLKYRRTDDTKYVQQAYDYLKESISLEKKASSEAVLATYLSASLTLYQNKLIDAGISIQDYILVSAYLDEKLKTEQTESLQKVKAGIDDNFVKDGPGDCETLISYFTSEYDSKKDDVAFLQMLTSLLKERNCIKSPLFYTASKALNTLAPSAESALNIAILAFGSEKYSEAVTYYQQAIDMETNDDKKADYYFGLSLSNNKLGNKSKSRENALKAASLRNNWGDPYLLIGNLYADSKDDCSSISLPNSVFWLAVDMFVKAKAIDPTSEEQANKYIAMYSKYYPNKEEAFFLNITEGNSFTIGCWINETTRARFNN